MEEQTVIATGAERVLAASSGIESTHRAWCRVCGLGKSVGETTLDTV